MGAAIQTSVIWLLILSFNINTSTCAVHRNKLNCTGEKIAIYELKIINVAKQRRMEHFSTRERKDYYYNLNDTSAFNQETYNLPKSPYVYNTEPDFPRDVTWEKYINAEPGEPPNLGKKWNELKKIYSFRAFLAMRNTRDNDISMGIFIHAFQVLYDKGIPSQLYELLLAKLPEGFPALIDVPVEISTGLPQFPSISSNLRLTIPKVQFKKLSREDLLSMEYDTYKEDK